MNFLVRKLYQFKGHDAGIYTLTEGRSSDTFFTAGGDNVIAEWNVKNFKPEKFAIKLKNTIYGLHHFKEQNTLVVGTSLGNLHWVDLRQNQEKHLLKLHKGGIFDIKPYHNNQKFVAASADGTISFWDVTSAKLIHHINFGEKKIRNVNISESHGLLLVCGASGYIYVVDLANYTTIQRFKAHTTACNVAIFHPEKNVIISGGHDAFIRVWNSSKNFEKVTEIPAHNYAIYQLKIDFSGEFLASASRDKTIKIWDAASLNLLKRLDKISCDGHLNSVNNLMWHKNSNYLVSVSDDRSIIVWEIQKA